MIRPSPNEFERLKNEEFNKRRLLRLKEVREHSKHNASKLRHLYKEQKNKVLSRLAENIQEEMNSDSQKKIDELKSKYQKQYNALGSAHNNAADWVDPAIIMQERLENNVVLAKERNEIAIHQIKVDKEEKDFIRNARLNALNNALLIEKERAVAIASLPPPIPPFYVQESLKNIEDMTPRVKVCDRTKFSVIESYETGSYNVERGTEETFGFNANNAMDAADLRQRQLMKMNVDLELETEEKSIIAQLRGHKAIRKQIVQKDYSDLLTNLEQISKGEMVKRQKEYHKNEFVGPNSAGYLGMGHMAAMMGYKERCRERAVESAVMDSLKDITNNTVITNNPEPQEYIGRGETKLTRLYDIIRRQKENVTFDNPDPCTGMKEENQGRDHISWKVSPEYVEEDLRHLSEEEEKEDLTKDTLQKATIASLKAHQILEKSNNEKELMHLERTIAQLDQRLDLIKENEEIVTGFPRNDHYKLSETIDMSYCSSLSREDRPIQTDSVCSDSLSIIRQFQKNALMKLSGHQVVQGSTYPGFILQRQFSELSLESTSVLEQSFLTRSSTFSSNAVSQENHGSSSSENNSSVSDWVRSQLRQTIEKIPDWVSRGVQDQNFLPDLNMSFMGSILNIRSASSCSKDDVHSSSSCSSTLLTRSSVVRHAAQSSITEVSNIYGNTSQVRATDVHNDSFFHEMESMKSQISGRSSDKLSEARSGCIDKDIQSLQHHQGEVLEETNDDTIDSIHHEDLISFESVEDVSGRLEEPIEDESRYRKALDDLFHMAQPVSYNSKVDNFTPKDDDVNGGSSIPLQDSHDPDICSSPSRNIEAYSHAPGIEVPSMVDSVSGALDRALISDYETFLSGLTRIHHTPEIVSDPKVCVRHKLPSVSEDETNVEESTNRTILENMDSVKEVFKETSFCDKELEEDKLGGKREDMDVSYFTSTTKEGHGDQHFMMTSSISPSSLVHGGTCTITQGTLSQEHGSFKTLLLPNYDVFSSSKDSSKTPLLPDYEAIVSSNNSMKPLSSINSDDNISECMDTPRFFENRTTKKMLSSTLKPDRLNVKILSPDVSSISNISAEACTRLKQRIMEEYFQKNKDLIMAGLSSTKSSELTLKPLDTCDDSTPRPLDSGKPSSRLTMEFSELNTERLTSEDMFATPRNDTNWTEYTPRDEWSTSHSNFQPLSDYMSSHNNDTEDLGVGTYKNSLKIVDLDETLTEIPVECKDTGNFGSINLINFDSKEDIIESISLQNEDIKCDASEGRVSSQYLSEDSEIQSFNDLVRDDSVPSKESSDTILHPFEVLASYHSSSSNSPSCQLNAKEIIQFEVASSTDGDARTDSRSEADVSSLSLASFLKNESMCQDPGVSSPQTPKEITPKSKCVPPQLIDGNEEMKQKLAQWKKERLLRINRHIPESDEFKSGNVTKTSSVRKQEEVDNKSRTLRLYRNLEEVQKKNEKIEAEKKKLENQLKKKEYAEKIRRMKKEKKGNVKG